MSPNYFKSILVLFAIAISFSSCKKDEPDPVEETEEVVASFSADPTVILFGESVNFTDESTGNPTSWSWSFEGGSPSTSEEQNPTVLYEEPGTWNVSLIASNEGSENSVLLSDFVTVEAPQFFDEPMFEGYTTTADIVYGIDENEHKLIVYEPKDDPRTNRPIIILAGGGGFAGSDLTLLEAFAAEITQYGFVVATAGYRTGPTSTEAEYQTMLIKGIQDTKAMVRYFREKSHVWGIDSDLIFRGGDGTGAIISLKATYWDESELDATTLALVNSLGGLEGDQGHAEHSSEVAGIVSLAGGMYTSIQYIDETDAAIFAVHGTLDYEVPYDYDTTSTGGAFYGSLPITLKADSVGLPNELFTIQNGFHDSPRESADDYADELASFLKTISE